MSLDCSTHLCISPAVPRKPFHINITIPTIATTSKNFVRVKKFQIALEGGSRAFADFQLTPPLGSSILSRAGAPSGVHESSTPLRLRFGPCTVKAEATEACGAQ